MKGNRAFYHTVCQDGHEGDSGPYCVQCSDAEFDAFNLFCLIKQECRDETDDAKLGAFVRQLAETWNAEVELSS